MVTKTIFEKSIKNRTGFSLAESQISTDINEILPNELRRQKEPNLPEVSELDALRHYIEISAKNHFIEKGFYPLGSCTMKYNPQINEIINTLSGITHIHPMQPQSSVQGALEIMYELQKDLAKISGFSQVSLQPVAGAQGEFTGVNIIYIYHKSKGRDPKKIIMPDSSHGTNPATTTMHGFEVVEIKSTADGKVDLDALKEIVDEDVAGFMLTNPNTLGVFETQVQEIADIIHSVDGLMYMDGANMNAILGYIRPGDMGFDITHFNLHKTFSTPHGGGGPGNGGVGVTAELEEFLPKPIVRKKDKKYYLDYSADKSIGKIHSFYGNFAVMVKAYIYIKMLGEHGLKRVAENAVINSNYLMKKIKNYFEVPYDKDIMHEFVATGKDYKKYGVKTLDIAKRMLDYGVHAPTIYFPLIVKEALMIEPTETEGKETLDEFIEAIEKITHEAENSTEKLTKAPTNTPIGRLNEREAIKKLDVKYNFNEDE